MTIYTSAAAYDITTLDMTGLLDHIRRNDERDERPRGYVGVRRALGPHSALVALVAVGGLLAVVAFWSLLVIGLLLIIL